MKCPNDQSEMKQTVLVGAAYGGPAEVHLKLIKSFMKLTNMKVAEKVKAWYCAQCGKIELYSEPNLKVEEG